jgi:hypothetical protein
LDVEIVQLLPIVVVFFPICVVLQQQRLVRIYGTNWSIDKLLLWFSALANALTSKKPMTF